MTRSPKTSLEAENPNSISTQDHLIAKENDPVPERSYVQVSIHYSVATALLDGKINISSYGDDKLQRPEIQEALDKVKMKVLPRWDPRGPNENLVRMTLKDGRVLERSTHRLMVHGTASDPLTEAELKDKFLYRAALTLPEVQAQEALEAWWQLGQIPTLPRG